MVLFRAVHLSGEGQQASWGRQRQLGVLGDAAARASTENIRMDNNVFNGIIMVVDVGLFLR